MQMGSPGRNGSSVCTETKGWDTVARLAQGVTDGLGVGDSTLAGRVAMRFLDGARERLDAGAHLLDQLSRRYRLGIVSNFYGNLATVCHEVGLLRAPFFLSSSPAV